MTEHTPSSQRRPISMSPACDESSLRPATSTETWISLLGGMYLIASGIRQNTFTGGVMASLGSCMAYRGAVCLLGAPSNRVPSPKKAERPDPSVVNNPVDEASWESFPASDSPTFSGITK